MRHPDIKVGVSYAFAQGKRLYNVSQVIVLDTAKSYVSDYSTRIDLGNGSTGHRGVRSSANLQFRKKAGMLGALRVEVRVKTDIDPETGQPWTDEKLGHWGRDRSLWVHSHWAWVPIAVQPRELRMTWEEWETQQATAAQRQAEAAERSRRHRVISEYDRTVANIAKYGAKLADYEAAIVTATQALAEARQAALEAVTKRNRPLSSQEVVSALLDPLSGAEEVVIGHPLEQDRTKVTPSLARQYVNAEDRLASAQGYLERQQAALAAEEEKLRTIDVPDPSWPEMAVARPA